MKGTNEDDPFLPVPPRSRQPEEDTSSPSPKPIPKPPRRQPLEDPELAYLLELRDQVELIVWKKIGPNEWREVASLPHMQIEAECFAAAGHLVAADVWSEELPFEINHALRGSGLAP